MTKFLYNFVPRTNHEVVDGVNHDEPLLKCEHFRIFTIQEQLHNPVGFCVHVSSGESLLTHTPLPSSPLALPLS